MYESVCDFCGGIFYEVVVETRWDTRAICVQCLTSRLFLDLQETTLGDFTLGEDPYQADRSIDAISEQ